MPLHKTPPCLFGFDALSDRRISDPTIGPIPLTTPMTPITARQTLKISGIVEPSSDVIYYSPLVTEGYKRPRSFC
jgi:hypothetical protein